MWYEYTWIVVVGALAAFVTAYGIGANDVANAFASSVAAHTLSMKHAVGIASICELSGAMLLGASVTRTVAGGIAKLQTFEMEPEIYMYGMLCALVAAAAWLLLATYWELAVSTTHSTIGGVLGFAFVYGGPRAVVWHVSLPSFPYTSGLLAIVISWVTSPLVSGVSSATLFLLVRTAVMRRQNSLLIAFWCIPLLVFLTVFCGMFMVLYKGASSRVKWSSAQCAWVASCLAAGVSVLTLVFAMPMVWQRVKREMHNRLLRQQQLFDKVVASFLTSLETKPGTSAQIPFQSKAATSGRPTDDATQYQSNDGYNPRYERSTMGGAVVARQATGRSTVDGQHRVHSQPGNHTVTAVTVPAAAFPAEDMHMESMCNSTAFTGSHPQLQAVQDADHAETHSATYSTPYSRHSPRTPATGLHTIHTGTQKAFWPATHIPSGTTSHHAAQQAQGQMNLYPRGQHPEPPWPPLPPAPAPPLPSLPAPPQTLPTQWYTRAATSGQPCPPPHLSLYVTATDSHDATHRGTTSAPQLAFDDSPMAHSTRRQPSTFGISSLHAADERWATSELQHRRATAAGGSARHVKFGRAQTEDACNSRYNVYSMQRYSSRQEPEGMYTDHLYMVRTLDRRASDDSPAPAGAKQAAVGHGSCPNCQSTSHRDNMVPDKHQDPVPLECTSRKQSWAQAFHTLQGMALNGIAGDIHEILSQDSTVRKIHQNAEVFDPATEHTFKYLQIITAICDSFAHGANDVANAVGPFAAIWYIYNNQRIDYKAGVPLWILAVGGVGIVIGLATYGYNLIRALGVKLAVITPCRGFCIELSTAMVVSVASKYGLPISTTHCQVGATMGVGLAEGVEGANWKLLFITVLGWVGTLAVTGTMSAAIFSFGVFAPSRIMGKEIQRMELGMQQLAVQMLVAANASNQAVASSNSSSMAVDAQMASLIQSHVKTLQALFAPGSSKRTMAVQTVPAGLLVEQLQDAWQLYRNVTALQVGK